MPRGRKPAVSGETESPAVLKVNLAEAKKRVPAFEDRKQYWIGVIAKENDKFENVVVGGQCFQKYHDDVMPDREGAAQRKTVKGTFIELSKRQVNKILADIGIRVVRGNVIHKVNHKNYKPIYGDIPLGKYLYMIDAKSINTSWLMDQEEPPTLVDQDEPGWLEMELQTA